MILAVSIPAFAEEIPGSTLLSYFSGSCKSSAQWTQSALDDSRALVKSLNAMISDPDCASASGAISQLTSLSSQLATLEQLNQTKNSIATLDAEEQQLLIHLTQVTDAEVKADINATLRRLQVSRAKLLNGDKSAEKLSGADKAMILGNIAHTANSSFQQITSNEKCLKKHPSLLNSATSIMAGVGAAVTLVNPAIGLSMTAGSTFTKVAMDGIRNARLARKIRDITDSTITFEAYSCALESMSDRWCQMKDAEKFLDFKARNLRHNFRNDELAQAITLNDREIPVILDWLDKVRNGVAPRTTADAERRTAVRTRELVVRAKSDHGVSLIEQNRKTYDSMSNKPEDQWNFLRTIIKTLAPQETMSSSMHESGPKNPLTDIYSLGYSPYYLLGLKETDPTIRSEDDGSFKPFEGWTKPDGFAVSLDSVKTKYIEWIDRATNLVNRELTEVQQPDPLQTLSSANMEAEPWMVTPIDALKTIADFLENNPPAANQRDFKKLYADTLVKLRSIHDVTVVAIATGDMNPRSIGDGTRELTPIEEIFEVAQLKYGIVVLQARLEMIVRLSLLEYIKNSPEEDQVVVAQLLASDRFYETISKMSGSSSYASLGKDIEKGQAYTMINLENFMELFGFNINRSLQKLYNEEKLLSPTAAKGKKDLRTSMCFLVLGAENVDEYIDSDLCSGLKMKARQTGGPESITINASTFKQDLKDRACTYREYFRQSDIYQKWGIKN